MVLLLAHCFGFPWLLPAQLRAFLLLAAPGSMAKRKPSPTVGLQVEKVYRSWGPAQRIQAARDFRYTGLTYSLQGPLRGSGRRVVLFKEIGNLPEYHETESWEPVLACRPLFAAPFLEDSTVGVVPPNQFQEIRTHLCCCVVTDWVPVKGLEAGCSR